MTRGPGHDVTRRRHVPVPLPAAGDPAGRPTGDGRSFADRSGVGPGDGDDADVGVEPERVPDGLGRVDDVGPAPVPGVALVHDAGHHGAPVVRAGDADRLVAPPPAGEPPRGQRRDQVAVAVVVPVARRGAAAFLALLEPVHRHHRAGAAAFVGRHRRGAVVVPGHGARRRQQQQQDGGGGGQERELGARHCCVLRRLRLLDLAVFSYTARVV
jgi:hypothetical protein